jgi:hypothetical protein
MMHLIPLVVATAFVTRRTADLERIKASRAGRYVAAEMTPPMVGLRVAGDVVTVIGAWQRRPFVIVIGSLLVIAGWTVGPSPSEPSHRASPPHVR